ncbi:MAG: SdrD B-like domain-containing protein, partial [Actinomycetota bacterium]
FDHHALEWRLDDESDFTVDFGFFEPLRVGNLVWEDNGAGTPSERNDGIAQAGEPGIEGVLVQLLDDAGDVVAETVTDADGAYWFDELDAGTYQVGIPEDQTPDLDPTLAGSIVAGALDGLTSSTGEGADPDNPSQSADNEATDSDDDGDPDPTNGWASLSLPFDLAFGAEPTGETAPDGADDEAAANTAVGDLVDENSNLQIDLGFAPANQYRVGNLVWIDANNDGQVDATETGIDGVTVELLDDAGDVVDTTTTADGGKYLFDGLDAGTYQIRIPDGLGALAPYLPSTGDDVNGADPDDDDDNDDNGVNAVGTTGVTTGQFTLGDPGGDPFAATEPTDETAIADGGGGVDDDPGTQGATTQDDQSNFSIDIGYFEPLRIGSTVWLDDGAGDTGLEDDGQQNNGESGIGGVLVQLLDDADTVIAETVTDANGDYVFDGLDAGDYRVGIPADQTPVLPGTPAPTPGATDDLRSSTYQTGTDTNSADNEANNADDDGITDTVGGVDFLSVSDPVNLGFGTEPETESNGDEARITALTGAPRADDNSQLQIDFGLSPTPTYRIGNLVFDDYDDDGIADDGEPGVEGVLVQLLDDTDAVIAEAVTDADGKYEFDGLAAGDYRAQIPADQTEDLGGGLGGLIDPDALTGARGSGSSAAFTPTDPDDDADNDTESIANVGGFGGATPADMVSEFVTVGEGTGNDEPVDEQLRSDDATDDDPGSQPTVVPDARSNLSVDFGIFRGIRIGNQVWLDDGAGANEDNGQFDADEVGISGVSVELWEDVDGDGVFEPTGDDAAGLLQVTSTDGEGNYHFAGVAPGLEVFVAVEDIPSGPTGVPVRSSTPTAADPLDDDNEDDAAPTAGFLAVTSAITVPDPGDATTGESDTVPAADDSEGDADAQTGVYPDTNSELTIDLGFVEVPLYRVGNLVWFDGDNDGIAEVGEDGIAGVLVQLLDDTGAVIAETVTDADGKYEFTNLAANDYRVRIPGDQTPVLGAQPGIVPDALDGLRSSDTEVADPDGTDGISDTDNDDNGVIDGDDWTSGVVTLGNADGSQPNQNTEPAGDATGPETERADELVDPIDDDTSTGRVDDDQSNVTVDFGFYGISLGNQVWYDADNSGTLDGGEAGIPAVTVELWEYNGSGDVDDIANYTLVDDQTTGLDGEYLFTGLADGQTYKVVIPEANFADGGPLDGLSSSTGSTDPTNTDADVDDDDNGIDPATPGGAVESGPVVMTAGAEPTAADGAENGSFENGTGEPDENDDLTVDFGFYGLALGDTIFIDDDNSGTLDAGESGVDGVTVELYEDTDGSGDFTPGVDALVDTDVTEDGGLYYFDGLAEGDYIVHLPPSNFAEDGPLDGYYSSSGNDTAPGTAPDEDDASLDQDDNGEAVDGENTEDAGGIATAAITLAAGSEPDTDGGDDPDGTSIPDTNENTQVDLGVYTLEVGNRIFFDDDNDETFDGADPGVEGVTVELIDDATGDVIATTTTGPDGDYLFTGLPEGTYRVRVPASNFAPGGPLEGTYSSDGPDASDTPADVDDDTSDVDDNGAPVDPAQTFTGGDVETLPFDLAAGSEPDDETDDSPTTDPAPVPDDNSNLTVDLGFTEVPTLELGNQLWFDLDNSGTYEAGAEDPVPDGVVVNLWTDPNGDGVPDTQVDTVTTTGGDGQYLFTDLEPGTYIVQLDPSNFEPGGPLAGFAPSTGPGSSTDPNDDTENNNDGFRSPDVPGVITGPVELTPAGEPTSGDGEVDAPSTGTRDEFSNLTVDIGLIPGLEVGNQIFIDAANDGDSDGDSPAPAGVVVNLLDEDGNVVDTTTTDADGQYLFSGLAPGTYVVELPAENFQSGGALEGFHPSTGPAASTDPNDDVDGNSDGIGQPDRSIRTGPVTLTPAGEPTGESDPAVTTENDFSNLTVDIGVYSLSFGDVIFTDLDNDGNQEPGEGPVPGVVLNLVDENGDPILDADGNPITTVTGPDGEYEFTGLPEGEYFVQVDPSNFAPGGPLDGLVSSTPTGGDDTGLPDGSGGVISGPITLTAPGGAEVASAFGFTPGASAGDTVWSDINRNGIQDPGEPGVPNVTVELLDPAGNVIATTSTDENGNYGFDDLEPGTYAIRFVAATFPDGARVTIANAADDGLDSDVDPTTLTTPPFTLGPGENNPTLDAGIVVAASLPRTGGDPWTVVHWAVLLLVVGLVLVLGVRRRRFASAN